MLFHNPDQNNLFGQNLTPFGIQILKSFDGLEVKTPYSKTFVEKLKNYIPFHARSWDNNLKVWKVAYGYQEQLCEIVKEVYGYCPELEDVKQINNKFQNQTYLIEYLGRSKEREDGSLIALGYCQNNWNVIFPEKVLKTFFEGEQIDSQQFNSSNYYSLLGIKQSSSPMEIKSAYRRMAKQWHPDVCSEPDARERFETINKAYHVLSDVLLRKRYNAGLDFETSEMTGHNNGRLYSNVGYAAPLRCGVITLDGEYTIGKILVTKIHNWTDWTDENGLTAVSSWDVMNNQIHIKWV